MDLSVICCSTCTCFKLYVALIFILLCVVLSLFVDVGGIVKKDPVLTSRNVDLKVIILPVVVGWWCGCSGYANGAYQYGVQGGEGVSYVLRIV